jgi:hypothetical protein
MAIVEVTEPVALTTNQQPTKQPNAGQIAAASDEYRLAAEEAERAAKAFEIQTQRAGQEVRGLQQKAEIINGEKIEGGKAVAGVALAGAGAKMGINALQKYFYNPETEVIQSLKETSKIMKSGKTAAATASAIIENAGKISKDYAADLSGATAPIITEAAKEHSSKLLGEIAQSNLDLTGEVAGALNNKGNQDIYDGIQRFADEVGRKAGQGIQKINPFNNPSKQLKGALDGLKEDIIEKSTDIANNNNTGYGVQVDLQNMVNSSHKELADQVVETSKLSKKVVGNAKEVSNQILENVGGGDAQKGLEDLSNKVQESYKGNWFAEGANKVRDWAKTHQNQANIAKAAIIGTAIVATVFAINEYNKNKDNQIAATQDQIEETKAVRGEWAARVAPTRDAALQANQVADKLENASRWQALTEQQKANNLAIAGRG